MRLKKFVNYIGYEEITMENFYISFQEGTIVLCDHIGLEQKNVLELINALPISFYLTKNSVGKVFANIELCQPPLINVDNFIYTRTLIHGGSDKHIMYVNRCENTDFIYLEYDDMSIEINKKKLGIKIFIRSFNIKELRFFIKSLALEILFSKGWFAIHGAAFTYKNKTFIIAGQKGDGKTTLLLNLLLYCDHIKLISNDRVLIRKKDDWFISSGDSSVRITNETLNMLQIAYGNKVDDLLGKVSSFDIYEKKTLALRNLSDRICENSNKLSGIIICKKDSAVETRRLNTVPQYIIIDDEEEHPDWIRLFKRNQKEGKQIFLHQEFPIIYYEKKESLYENAKNIINSINYLCNY